MLNIAASVGDGTGLQQASLLSVLGTRGTTVGIGAECGSDCLAEISLNVPENTMLGHQGCWLSVLALSGHVIHVCSFWCSETAALKPDALLLCVITSNPNPPGYVLYRMLSDIDGCGPRVQRS